ncbi:CdaR family transcriptional regulator [Parageobacillus thermoglucosidasius]|uniref:CdaR family transcriptional regulator n=1 Tax=Parageobacillus thermoglucosidasius TaxID=1426 RepID=UPI000AAF145A|nr:sugar diacid recognition domain-containing protein [Parageobacillus thermoglucosidasius]
MKRAAQGERGKALYRLSKKQAQMIVDKMMEDIPYNINIMNEKGIIIGSGDPKRIGTLHKGAVEAIKKLKMVTIYEDNKNEKKGTNEPIIIDNQVVGVIGITGEPEEVKPFCKIVKTTVSLLIEQGIALKKIESEGKKRTAFLKKLLDEKHHYSSKMIEEAKEYQLDLNRKTTVLYVKNLNEKYEIASIILKYPSFFEEDHLILMLHDTKDIHTCIESLLAENKNVTIGIGNHLTNIATSYNQAKRSVFIVEKLSLPKRVIFYNEVAFLVKLSELDLDDLWKEKHIKKNIENDGELLKTLKRYIVNNCNSNLTAQDLNIHRNTLQYRLNKIKEITGKDPKNILELFELICYLLNKN